jgi:hypothetical protein
MKIDFVTTSMVVELALSPGNKLGVVGLHYFVDSIQYQDSIDDV